MHEALGEINCHMYCHIYCHIFVTYLSHILSHILSRNQSLRIVLTLDLPGARWEWHSQWRRRFPMRFLISFFLVSDWCQGSWAPCTACMQHGQLGVCPWCLVEFVPVAGSAPPHCGCRNSSVRVCNALLAMCTRGLLALVLIGKPVRSFPVQF